MAFKEYTGVEVEAIFFLLYFQAMTGNAFRLRDLRVKKGDYTLHLLLHNFPNHTSFVMFLTSNHNKYYKSALQWTSRLTQLYNPLYFK